jgi:hypothetical protein
MMRGNVQYLILVHSDETRSMIPACWTDLALPSGSSSEYQNTASVSSSTIGSINHLIAMRQKVDFLLQRSQPFQEENADACGTNDSNGSDGTSDYRKADLE